jgi:hypothetical protein
MATHKFSEHLLHLSENKDIEEAKKEWEYVCEQTLDQQTGHCICQRKIKYVVSMFNIRTFQTISVGSTCYKKFDFKPADISQALKIVIDMLRKKGEYALINDFHQHVLNNEQIVIEYYQAEYRANMYNIAEMIILKEHVYYLITNIKIMYLQETLTIIETRIEELQEKERQRELDRQERKRLQVIQREQELQRLQEWKERKQLQEEQERKKQAKQKKQEEQIKQLTSEYNKYYNNSSMLEQLKTHIEECEELAHLEEIYSAIMIRLIDLKKTKEQQIEEDRIKQLQKEQEEKEYLKRKEELQLEEEEKRAKHKRDRTKCACGLEYGNICKCKSSKYTLVPSGKGPQLSCTICKLWKDRCK